MDAVLPDRGARAATRAAIAAFAARWRSETPLGALARALDALEQPDAATVAALIRPALEDVGWIVEVISGLVAEVARDAFFAPPMVAVRSDVQAG